jgi:hypothetical protein
MQIQWIPHYIKAPRLIQWQDVVMFVGRADNPKTRQKDIILYEDYGEIHPLFTLASGKDGSYAGLLQNPRNLHELWISLYSDHERIGTSLQGKYNDIWLAKMMIAQNYEITPQKKK